MSASVPVCIARIASPFAQLAVDDADVGDDAAVLVELGVEDQRARRRRRRRPRAAGRARRSPRAAPRRPAPVLARDPQHVVGRSPISSSISPATRSGSAPGRSILFSDGDQLEAGVDRQVGVGDRLRLDALRGVDEQQRALARGQDARDLVGEVDVAGRVDQVQPVRLAVARRVLDAHGLRLDRDAALALELHRVEQLRPVLRARRRRRCVSRMRSASVDFPWSMWAMIEKLRMFWAGRATNDELRVVAVAHLDERERRSRWRRRSAAECLADLPRPIRRAGRSRHRGRTRRSCEAASLPPSTSTRPT